MQLAEGCGTDEIRTRNPNLMLLHGIVMKAELVESPAGGDSVDLALVLQGVGPAQPRQVYIPFSMLLEDPTIDPDSLRGHGIEAEVSLDDSERWLVSSLRVKPKRVLRPEP